MPSPPPKKTGEATRPARESNREVRAFPCPQRGSNEKTAGRAVAATPPVFRAEQIASATEAFARVIGSKVFERAAVRVATMFDKRALDIPCPQCGHKTQKSVAWLRDNSDFTCVGCGRDIHLEADQFRSGIKRAESQIAAMLRNLGKIGKR